MDAERTGPPRGGPARERLRRDPDESVFGERTGGPATLAVIGKPIVRGFVMNVRALEERDEDVHIQQDRRPQQSSSRSLLTISIVIGGEPGALGGSKGTPFRIVTFGLAGDRAFLTRSETTLPIDVPWVAAISLAACSTSSSMSSVVRTRQHHASRIRCQ